MIQVVDAILHIISQLWLGYSRRRPSTRCAVILLALTRQELRDHTLPEVQRTDLKAMTSSRFFVPRKALKPFRTWC